MLRMKEGGLRYSERFLSDSVACVLRRDIEGDMRENVVRGEDKGKCGRDKICQISCISTVFMI